MRAALHAKNSIAYTLFEGTEEKKDCDRFGTVFCYRRPWISAIFLNARALPLEFVLVLL